MESAIVNYVKVKFAKPFMVQHGQNLTNLPAAC